MDTNSPSVDGRVRGERCGVPFSQTTPESTPPSTSDDSWYLYELLLMETPLGTQPTDPYQSPQICAACSASQSLAQTSPLAITFRPPKWRIIPQRPYKQKQWDYTAVEPILFQVDGYPGVNMEDAFRNRFTNLEGRDDLVLRDAVGAFSCRLLFPGYPANEKPQVFTKSWKKERDPITRSKLAYQVARKVKHYLDSMSSSHTMDASTTGQWKIGEGFMFLENMFLAKLESVSKGSFQPEIWVVDPTV